MPLEDRDARFDRATLVRRGIAGGGALALSAWLPRGRTSAATEPAARRLAAAAVIVSFVDVPYVPAKAVVADDWSYVGSANLTTASLDANREIGLSLTDGVTVRLVARTIAEDLERGRWLGRV